MSDVSESEVSVGGGGSVNRALVECDRQGTVRWMDDTARAAFGQPENLMDVVWQLAPSGPAGLLRHAPAARLSPVLQRGDAVWISAELAGRGATAPSNDCTLLDVQNDFLRHYFRLQNLERAITARARQLRRWSGAQAVLQVDRERQRLGSELHTSVGQMLAAIRLQLEIIASQQADPPSGIRFALDQISTLASDALEYVRSISKRLHPPEWQRLTLEDALHQLWDLSGIPQRFEASLRVDKLPEEPALETKVLMYRAAQEALSNLTRHSRATRIDMNLRAGGGRLLLTVEDNGVGFDVDRFFSAPANVASGIGLRSIREQAAALNGTLSIQSGPNGTKLEVSAPFSPGRGES